MLILIFRAFFLYLFVILIMRIMGKREIGQLQPYELAITLIISELVTLPMENNSVPLQNGVIPAFVITLTQLFLSYLTTKNQKIQDILSGTYTVIIKNGKLMQENMKKQKYNITELLEALRMNGVNKIDDVQYAILETSGQLSVLLKPVKQPVTVEQMNILIEYEEMPTNIILDGKIVEENIKELGININDVNNELAKEELKIEDVFYAYINTKGEYHIQKKEI